MAIKPYPFRPRVSERDIIDWMDTYKARGQLRQAFVEAIRLHIALREGRFPELAREKYGVVVPQPGGMVDRETLRETLLSIVPELADALSQRLGSITRGVSAGTTQTEGPDEQAEQFRQNFVDARMFDDEDL